MNSKEPQSKEDRKETPDSCQETDEFPLTIWVDADACPKVIKSLIFRTSKRLQLPVVLVANGEVSIPNSKLVRMITVPQGADIADDHIVDMMLPNDLVITQDIPLAARVVAKGGTAIGPRGRLYDEASVHGHLATRNLMEQIRSTGVHTGGPRPLNDKHVQTFANLFDKTLTRLLKNTTKK